MAASGVTQIDAKYLNTLKAQLSDLESQVKAQIRGIGPSSSSETTNYINPVNELTLLAGPPGFDAGAAITNALKTVGGSVYDQLQWLDKVLNDMIEEITTTVNSFHGAESLNDDAVNTLINEFQGTIGDMGSPATPSSPNPNPPPANPNPTPAN
jgi:hypothetical protein